MDGFFFSFLGRWSYLGLFVVLLAAGLGVPLPEDIPLVVSGWLVYHGHADLRLMIGTGLIGVLLGDTLLFYMGRRYGMHLVEHRWFRRVAKPWLVEKARAKYQAHGAKILFAARFMPGLRSALFLTAGTFRIPFWKFIFIDGFAAAISVPTWVWVSYKFSGRVEGSIERLLSDARLASYVLGGVILAALTIWFVWEYYHNLRKRNGVSGIGAAPAAAASGVAASMPAEPAGQPAGGAANGGTPAGASTMKPKPGKPVGGGLIRRSV